MSHDTIKRLVELENEAKDFGFYWDDHQDIIKQIQSECLEIQELVDQSPSNAIRMQEEIGDLLHAAFSLCVFCDLDPEITLKQAVAKFNKRFNLLQFFAHQAGYQDLQGRAWKEKMNFWNQAKKLETKS